jgi:4-amino-4-deoxy-L-arabinose transferase-like glycosyltransferase
MHDDDRPGRSRSAIALAAIVAAGAILRAAWLDHQSYWYDESVSAEIARAPLEDILRGAPFARDLGNPPLYYALLHAVARLVGDGDVALRALSVVAGTLSIPLVFDVGRRTLGARVGLVAAALFAVAPAAVYFAQEARTYALTTLLALATVDALLAATRRPRSLLRWAAVSAALFFTVYAHYFGVFLGVALVVAVALDRRRRPALLGPLALACGAAAAVWLAAWGPAFVAQLRAPGNLARSAETWWAHVLATPLFYSVGTTLLWKDAHEPWRLVAAGLACAAFAVPAAAGLHALRDRAPAARVLLPWLLLPTLGPALVSALATPLYAVRYVLLAAPAFLLVVALGLVELGKGARLASVAGITAGAAVSLASYFGEAVKHDWRAVARAVDALARPGDVLVFDADIGETPFARYARGSNRRVRLLPPDPAEPDALLGAGARGATPRDVTAELAAAPRVIALFSDPLSGSRGRYPLTFERDFRTVFVLRFRGVEVRVTEPRGREPMAGPPDPGG